MNALRPNNNRAQAAITMIIIVIVIEIISILSGYLQYNLLQKIAQGEVINVAIADDNDSRTLIITVIYAIAMIISAITFIQWFRRAYYNLSLTVNNLSSDDGWAVGAWFVPIISLFKPYQMMKEMYDVTRRLFEGKRINVYPNLSNKYLTWWWAFWIIYNISSQILNQIADNFEDVNGLINYTIGYMAISFFGIPLAILAIKVIKDYSRVEPLLLEISDDVQEEIIDNNINNDR